MGIVVAIAILAAGVLSYLADRDWHSVATVDGVSISRADLRARVTVIDAMQRLLDDRHATASPSQASALEAVLSGDPAEIARQQLIEEALLRAEAKRRGLSATAADAAAELEEVVNGVASVQLRWVRLLTASRSPAEVASATRAVADALVAGEDVSRASGAVDASWRALGAEMWLDRSGQMSPTVDIPPAAQIAAARTRGEPGAVPNVDDGLGHTYVAAVSAVAPGRTIGAELLEALKASGVSDGAISSWGEGRALRKAVVSALRADWIDSGGDQVRMAELPIGTVTAGAPRAEFAVLNLTRLDPADPLGRSTALLAELRALQPAARAIRFGVLGEQANAGSEPTPLERSGELGWFARDEILEALGDEAFAEGRTLGDVIGPIDTTVGPELFLLEARYAGGLDDRAAAIVIEARSAGADFRAIAARVAPGDAGRADSGPWRALSEFTALSRTAAGLNDAGAGQLVGPINIGGTVVFAKVLERRSAPFDPDTLGRLELTGLSVWLADRLAYSKIVLDPDPLGLGLTPPPASVPVPGSGGVPTTQTIPTRIVPIQTPHLPTLPAP